MVKAKLLETAINAAKILETDILAKVMSGPGLPRGNVSRLHAFIERFCDRHMIVLSVGAPQDGVKCHAQASFYHSSAIELPK